FSPDAFSPDAFSPDAFSGAQTRSLLGVSAFQGTAGEGLIVNSWDNTGYFYVRVRGANSAFDQQSPFHLEVSALSGSCGAVEPITTTSTFTADAGNYKTIILTDFSRLVGTAAEKAALQSQLATFAARSEVAGAIVDVGTDARVNAANAQADAHLSCPYAKNLVAGTIRDIVDAYWTLNPSLAYVLIVGDDGVVPFFRYPDNALLANENNYVPPVRDASASQASLRLGYVLGQDAYGSRVDISSKNTTLPVPGLAVGRLVETAVDATDMLNAYLTTNGGQVDLTTPPLVTGYDFLADAATAVQSELEAGTGETADTLIADSNLSPADPAAWTADDLRNLLLGSRHDITFLAGHFSANSALAADYSTRLTTNDLSNSSVDLQNAIIFSAGCHAGYNIVDGDSIPFDTRNLDWMQAFAHKGATVLAGTGYQYGDTEFIEYSERLYLEFSRQLRTGTGAVSVGQAMVAAKQDYLANTAQLRGIHEKALIEATLFGFPMLSVDMPGARLSPTSDTSVVGQVTPATTNPGQSLGLSTADVTVTPVFSQHTVELTNLADANTPVTAFYLSGSDGI
ncbi:MAG: C25 family cysteine peptidase, partial [Anaerolineae bacterium]